MLQTPPLPAQYLLGVDTGGTYTDAAIVDLQRHQVIACAKALTTQGDLTIGVIEAITRALSALPRTMRLDEIGLVSVSTTLATNAVVEGHGSAAGVILIGFDAPMLERAGIAKAFPGMPVALIAGGHDHNGDELTALDTVGLGAALQRMAPMVEAFAVASRFAVRNASHEIAAGEFIAARTGKPVTLSSELSSALDAPRRALTAVLNARLVSRVSLLIEAVQRAMLGLDLRCPLMIVKGDGSLALAAAVARRPIETVLSGPAASLIGAQWLSGLNDFIMADMGGTTTDLGVLLNGRLRVAQEGAKVGHWRTMVRAIDVHTTGLGGDSEVGIGSGGQLTIGPQRIVPIALIAARCAEVATMLEADLADSEVGPMHGRIVVLPFGAARTAVTGQLRTHEAALLRSITDRPQALRKVATSLAAQRAVVSLRRRGLLQLCGFTPSDAAHVLGLQANWCRDAALLAAQLCLRQREMQAPTPQRAEGFARDVWHHTVRLSARAVLDVALGGLRAADALLDAVCSGQPQIGLARVRVTPSVPIVAIGGPVKVYYAELARRLGCEVVFPAFHDVANAVGAATGVIAHASTVTIDGDGSGMFRVHTAKGALQFSTPALAIEAATTLATQTALEAVILMGAFAPQVSTRIHRDMLPGAVDDSGLLKAVIVAEAIGRPKTARMVERG